MKARPYSTTIAAKPVRRRSFTVHLPRLRLGALVYRKKASRDPLRGWVIHSMVEAPHSHTGKRDYFGNIAEVNFESGSVTRDKIAKHVLEALVSSFRHEVRELLTIDGRKAFPDPHVKKGRSRR